jgi:intergrase/recombinase
MRLRTGRFGKLRSWDKFYTAAPRRLQAVRRAIQHSQERVRSLAKRYGINLKTVAKWKHRQSVDATEP